MPYKSEAQRRKLNQLAKEGKISEEKVNEFNEASKGMKLPERLTPKKQKITSVQQLRELGKKK
jgi:hypothetical protein